MMQKFYAKHQELMEQQELDHREDVAFFEERELCLHDLLPVVARVGDALALARHGLGVEVLAEGHLLGHGGLLEPDAQHLRLRAVRGEHRVELLGLGELAVLYV